MCIYININIFRVGAWIDGWIDRWIAHIWHIHTYIKCGAQCWKWLTAATVLNTSKCSTLRDLLCILAILAITGYTVSDSLRSCGRRPCLVEHLRVFCFFQFIFSRTLPMLPCLCVAASLAAHAFGVRKPCVLCWWKKCQGAPWYWHQVLQYKTRKGKGNLDSRIISVSVGWSFWVILYGDPIPFPSW